jgi:hypothetical protein
MMFKDGESTELRAAMQLGDGTTILPEGKIITRDGSSRRLLDGELFQLEGGVVPARDTITLQNGRVMVQKDGAMLAVEPGRSVNYERRHEGIGRRHSDPLQWRAEQVE